MKKILLMAAAALISGAAVANAAEFNGAYGALSAGIDATQFGTKSANGSGDSLSATGFTPGVIAGYQQSYGKYVLGVEGDISYATGKYVEGGATLSNDWNYGLKLRPGYKVTPTTAVFVSGGIAYDTFAAKTSAAKVNPTQFGETVGAGLETYVSPNFTVRADYEHGFYDAFAVGNTRVTPNTDTFTVGIGYHFN